MKISFSKLSTKDLATLAQRTISASQNGNYTVIANHALLQNIINQYSDYDTVYTKLSHSGKGEEVATADHKRDRNFRGMKSYLSGFTKLPDIEFHQDASDLYTIFKNYGLDIDRMSYSAQTAQMKKLIEELEKEDNTNKLENLKLSSIFTQMKTSQTEFESLYQQQAEANAELRNLPSASSIRTNLEKALKNYYSLLTAMKDVDDWKMIYADINELVKSAKNSTVNKSINPPKI